MAFLESIARLMNIIGKLLESSLTLETEKGWPPFTSAKEVELAVGSSIKAKEYYENALAISKETGNRTKEADSYLNLGRFFFAQPEFDRAEDR